MMFLNFSCMYVYSVLDLRGRDLHQASLWWGKIGFFDSKLILIDTLKRLFYDFHNNFLNCKGKLPKHIINLKIIMLKTTDIKISNHVGQFSVICYKILKFDLLFYDYRFSDKNISDRQCIIVSIYVGNFLIFLKENSKL